MSWRSEKRDRGASDYLARPRARTDRLVTEHVGDEVLVYDQTNDEAHCLSRQAAIVWQACDGNGTVEQIAAALAVDADAVRQALNELADCGLLESARGITRRDAGLRAAKLGRAAIAAPLIYSIVAPTPALAASQNFCLNQGCQSGCGHCKAFGCACCGPGGGDVKLCTADCSTANCNPTIVNTFHCGTPVTSTVCNT